MGLYSGELIIGRVFASEIWGAYFREGIFLGGLSLEFYGIIFTPGPQCDFFCIIPSASEPCTNLNISKLLYFDN